MPVTDTYGVLMRKDSSLASKETVSVEELLDVPLICSRQGMVEDYPKVFQEKMDSLHVVATLTWPITRGCWCGKG